MSHNRNHIISSYMLPIFSDPENREKLGPHMCAKIDAMCSQTEFSDKDVRRLLLALGVVLDE